MAVETHFAKRAMMSRPDLPCALNFRYPIPQFKKREPAEAGLALGGVLDFDLTVA